MIKYLLSLERNENGSRTCTAIVSNTPIDPNNYADVAVLPDELLDKWNELSPCCNFTEENHVITSLEDDPEGRAIYEEWLANQPEVPDTPGEATEPDIYDEMAAAYDEGVQSA